MSDQAFVSAWERGRRGKPDQRRKRAAEPARAVFDLDGNHLGVVHGAVTEADVEAARLLIKYMPTYVGVMLP